MRIVCLGDSNTWGFDPGSYFGGRYDVPWPEKLAQMTGWEVINAGENGCEIPRREYMNAKTLPIRNEWQGFLLYSALRIILYHPRV